MEQNFVVLRECGFVRVGAGVGAGIVVGAGAGAGLGSGGRGRGVWVQRARGQGRGRGQGQARFFEGIKCYNCNEMGHYKSSCTRAPEVPSTPARGTQVRRLQRAFRGTPGANTSTNRKRPRSMDPPTGPNLQQGGGAGAPKFARSEWGEC